jgi:tetratricopeptide (TPR) repeat protein
MSPEPSSSKIGKSVGEKLRAARVAQRYTQSKLAAPDFSVSYISAIERGQIHPSLRALEILAARLGLSSTQLLPTKAQQDERYPGSLSFNERDDDEVELLLLEAQVQIRQGVAQSAIEQLEALSPKRLKRAHHLQHHYLLGWAYYKVARYQECDYTLTEALQLAKELQDQYLHVRILNLQALAQAAMRNYAQALVAHQHCLEILEQNETQDPFFTAQIYMHMGLHYNQLGNAPQALVMFHKALELTENLSSAQDVQHAYLQMCQQYSDHKEYDLATFSAHKSTQLHHWEVSKQLKSELYNYIGQALLQEDMEQAQAFFEQALAKERLSHDPLTLASIKSSYAEWFFTQRQLEQAEHYAHEAYEEAQHTGDTVITANALIVLGRIEYAQHKLEDGDSHFVAGLAMLGRLESHEELARESVRYAELLEQAGKEHEAFTYFRSAFQSQQKLGK